MKKILTFLILLICVGVQAQSLKGYGLGMVLGNKNDSIETTVAGVPGVVSVQVGSNGKVIVLKFNAAVNIRGAYGRIKKKKFSIYDFVELVNARFKVCLKFENEVESFKGTPFEGATFVGWNNYREEQNGVRYSVNYYCNSSTEIDNFDKIELKIEDILALKLIEKKRVEKIHKQEQIEFDKKLNDF